MRGTRATAPARNNSQSKASDLLSLIREGLLGHDLVTLLMIYGTRFSAVGCAKIYLPFTLTSNQVELTVLETAHRHI